MMLALKTKKFLFIVLFLAVFAACDVSASAYAASSPLDGLDTIEVVAENLEGFRCSIALDSITYHPNEGTLGYLFITEPVTESGKKKLASSYGLTDVVMTLDTLMIDFNKGCYMSLGTIVIYTKSNGEQDMVPREGHGYIPIQEGSLLEECNYRAIQYATK